MDRIRRQEEDKIYANSTHLFRSSFLDRDMCFSRAAHMKNNSYKNKKIGFTLRPTFGRSIQSVLAPSSMIVSRELTEQMGGRGGSIGRASASRSNRLHDQRFESRAEHKQIL